MRLMMKRTGAKVIAMAMCEHNRAPSDAASPQDRHEHICWWLVSPGLYSHAPRLAGMKITAEAGHYTTEVCDAWAQALRAAYEGKSFLSHPPIPKEAAHPRSVKHILADPAGG